MVNIEDIDNVITDLLVDNKYFDFKCMSRAKIMERLNSMTEDEIYEKLGEVEDLLSDYEIQFLEEWSSKWEKVKNKDWSKFPPHFQKELESLGEAIYNIESKIFTKKGNDFGNFNRDDYTGDDMPYESQDNGALEQKQVEYQDNKLKDVDWDFYGDGTDFYGDKYYHINKSLLLGDEYWSEVEKEFPNNNVDELKADINKSINHLNYLMDNSGGLQENTILYRGGQIPYDLMPGMKGKFKTFSSTSYNREKAEGYVQEGKECLITIYAPKGTRGLNGNGHMYNGNSTIGWQKEHEFTLGVGQEYIVLNRDNKTDPPVVEIMLI